ncbi:MAG TPA: 50S ribosomal protein L29 [Candidatus Binatia bacterium]|jgi:large subunit ribosomal protein L29
MQAKELRDLGEEELTQKRRELKEELFHLKLRKATGRLENAMKIREDRRDLARIETVLKEKSKGGK